MGLAKKLLRLEGATLVSPPASPPLDLSRDARLEDLRARMQAILSRTAAGPPAPRPDPPPGSIPFVTYETDLGPLHARTLHLLPSHRTGRVPILASRHARPDVLGLLALDSSLAGCDPTRALYVDTETTGLHGGTGTIPFLVGLAFWSSSPDAPHHGFVVEQLLLKSPGEEAPVLERLATRMREASMLVSFNGKAFDLPLLRTRFAMARIAMPVEPPHLDLVHVARRVHKARRCPCRLKSVEDLVLGFVREDDVPSSEVSAHYLHYLRSGDGRALMGVVDHNAWDVVSMASLVGLYGEPLETTALAALDLVGVGRTLFRAGERARAMVAVERAVSRGAGEEAVLCRAELARRTGDRAGALRDFETLRGPHRQGLKGRERVHLELAKLYEHHAKDYGKALEMARLGTGEKPAAALRRVARLEKKAARPLRRSGARVIDHAHEREGPVRTG